VTGLTLDTGALIALEAGSRRMALRVKQAVAAGAELAIPAGVVAQAWRGGARQARIAKLLQLKVTSVVPLDAKLALRVGATCASTGSTDVVDVSVALCARDRGHWVVTTDPADIAKIDPALTLIRPMLTSTPLTGRSEIAEHGRLLGAGRRTVRTHGDRPG